MGMVRERWEGIQGYDQGQAVVGRHTGTWAWLGSAGEAYGAMGWVRERWGGIWGYGQGQAVLGRHAGLWAGSGSGGER